MQHTACIVVALAGRGFYARGLEMKVRKQRTLPERIIILPYQERKKS